jgi:hypothetical protein
VELSSVRLMIAVEGNRGVSKANKARMPVLGGASWLSSLPLMPSSWRQAERNRMRVPRQSSDNRMVRVGRMANISVRDFHLKEIQVASRVVEEEQDALQWK